MPERKVETADGDSAQDYIAWLDEVWARRLSARDQHSRGVVIGILLWPGFPLLSLTGIIESLRHAGDFGDQSRQIEGRWEILGNPDLPVRASCGLEFRPTCHYIHPAELDYLFVLGGLLSQLHQAPVRHRQYIRLARQSGCKLVGVCTGSFVLVEEGYLEGITACIHPYHQGDFEQRFPRLPYTTHRDYSIEDGLITVPGGTSILALMAHIISTHYGADRSAKVSHQLSLPDRRGMSGFDRSAIIRHMQVDDPRIQRAIAIIENAQDTPLSVADLARTLGMSERHFSRLFTHEVGVSPREYLLRMRLKLAVWLLQHSSRSITSVAYDVGFSSVAHLSTLCSKRFGKTPSEIRKGHSAEGVESAIDIRR